MKYTATIPKAEMQQVRDIYPDLTEEELLKLAFFTFRMKIVKENELLKK